MLKLENGWSRLSYPELVTAIVYQQKQLDGTLKEEKDIRNLDKLPQTLTIPPFIRQVFYKYLKIVNLNDSISR